MKIIQFKVEDSVIIGQKESIRYALIKKNQDVYYICDLNTRTVTYNNVGDIIDAFIKSQFPKNYGELEYFIHKYETILEFDTMSDLKEKFPEYFL